MPSATSTFIAAFGPDFFLKIMEGAALFVVQILEAMFVQALHVIAPYLPWLFGALLIVLVISTIRAMRGEWGALGSLIYHLLYFGGLGIIIWIKGWEILSNTYFDIITAVLYRLCYWVTGLFLGPFRRR